MSVADPSPTPIAPSPTIIDPSPTPLTQAPIVRDTRAAGLRAGAGIFVGFVILAIVNAIAIAVRVPLPSGGVPLRVAHHAFDFAQTLGIGVIAALLIGGFSAIVRLPVWGFAIAYTAATAPLIYLGLGDQVRRQANVMLEGRFAEAFFLTMMFFTTFAITAAHFLGAFVSRYRFLRPLPVIIAVVGLGFDHHIIRDEYINVHVTLAWIAITLGGAGIAPLAERAGLAIASRRGGRIAIGIIAAASLLSLAIPPSNAVRKELFRQPCAVAPWLLASTIWRAPHAHTVVDTSSRWFKDRTADPPVSPTMTDPFGENPVVVLITIDATRAEAINDPKNDALFPTFAEMKRKGVWFPNANSAGGQTAVSLTTAFSGRYFSELQWAFHGVGSSRFIYAASDPATRYPELLSAADVETSIFCSINFLSGEYGVARGFREETIIPVGRRHALAKQVIDPVLDRLRRQGPEPLFLYTHLMEPHSPYDRGKTHGSAYDRYISEIAIADAQVARVVRLLDQRFAGRGVLIISADHGEAFGEHESHEHTKTLYDELLRVPLLVRGAGVTPRKVEERVGLIDIGPTILDIFGVPTPATFNGQSLVPILKGRPAKLDRPLLAEGRLRKALYTTDGLKVITDERRTIVEVYDLTRDPGETRNIFESDRERSDRALATLEAFFATHTVKDRSYRAPYKP